MYSRILLILVFSATRVFAASTGALEPDLSRVMSSQIVAQCEAPMGLLGSTYHARLEVPEENRSDSLVNPVNTISLIRTGKEYDVLLGERSIVNGELLRNAGDDEFSIHLLLDRDTGPEHLVFILEPDGTGELLWSSNTRSVLTACQTKRAGL
jgi:hypothetical protein